MPRAYRSKKRKVTTCTECHRRKQRCDRQFPCNYCIQRDIPEKCHYHLDRSSSIPSEFHNGNSLPDLQRDNSVDDVSNHAAGSNLEQVNQEQLELPSQIGYQVSQNVIDQPSVVHEAGPELTMPLKPLFNPSKIGREKWAKYCKISSTLPERSVIQGLIDVFFGEANWYFTVLDRYYFDVAHRSWLKSCLSLTGDAKTGFLVDDLCFPALLYQVIAVGVHFVPERSILAHEMIRLAMAPSDHLSQNLSDAGDSILDLLGRHHHSILAVQADLMRCAWLKNSGYGAEAWHKLGSAIRQAQDMGLHLEPLRPTMQADTTESFRIAWYNEHKRRLWACLFTWESHMALQLSRPRSIHASDCTISMPIFADMPQEPARTLFEPTDTKDKPPTVYSQIVKYTLAQIIQKAMSAGAFNHNCQVAPLLQGLHEEVTEMLGILPPALRMESPDTTWDIIYPDVVKHRIQISIIVNSFLLSLHRPHIKHCSASLDAGMDAAMKVLDLSQRLFEQTPKHQHKTFTLIFYTIDAGILLAAMMASLSREDVRYSASRQCLREAIDRLGVLKVRNKAAAAGQKALSICLCRLPVPVAAQTVQSQSMHEQLMQPSYSGTDVALETPISDRLDGSTAIGSSEEALPHNLDEPWDFLPTFDGGEDLLTAMIVDPGFTSGWLEQSLEGMSSWDTDPTHANYEWIASF